MCPLSRAALATTGTTLTDQILIPAPPMITSELLGHTCTDTVCLYTLPIPPMQRQKSLSLSVQHGYHTELAADAASFCVLSKNILFLGILPDNNHPVPVLPTCVTAYRLALSKHIFGHREQK